MDNVYKNNKMFSLAPALYVVVVSVVVSGWKNSYDQPLNFNCHSDLYSISRFTSKHDNGPEDRIFDFECRRVYSVSGAVYCSWSGYVNNYDALVLFTCPNEGYLNGVHSVHHNGAEDRIFKFRCCTPRSGHCLKNCHWTGFVNGMDAYFSYFVPYSYVIRGVSSIHDNGPEDRIFQFEICQVF